MTIANKYSLVLPLGEKCDKEVTISFIGINELKEVMPLLKNYFVPYEPLCLGVGASFEDIEDYLKRIAFFCLKQNMSVGARNKEGELVGFAMIVIQHEDDDMFSKHLAAFAENNENVRKLLNVLKYSKHKYDVFSDQEVEEVMYISAANLHPDYHGGKIAVDMIKMAEKKAIAKGLKVSECLATGIRSKINGQRLGMKIVSETDYKTFDFLDFKKMRSSTHCTIMMKKLV